MLLLTAFPLVGLFEIFFPFYPIRFGHLKILPLDFVYFLMILSIGRYALLNPRSMGKLIRENFFLAAFLGVVALYVVVYTPIHGHSAVGEARKFYFIFLFPLLALISIKSQEDLRRLFLVLVFVASCIALVALAKVGMHGSILRVLNSEATLTVALVAFAMLIHRINKIVIATPLLDRALLLLFSVIVLGSGQRTVWLAVGVGLMLMFWLYRHRPILASKMVMLGVVVLMGLTTAVIMFPEAGSRVIEKFAGIIDPYSDQTASWRIQGWQSHWATVKENVLFGEGLGSYYSWKFRGKYEVNASPHNGYLQMMLKFGLFGLTMYALLALRFFHRTLAMRRKLRPGPMRAYIESGVLTFGAAHAFMLGYGLEPIALIFFAVAACAAKLCQEDLQRSRVLQGRAVGNDPEIASQRFRPRRAPAAFYS